MHKYGLNQHYADQREYEQEQIKKDKKNWTPFKHCIANTLRYCDNFIGQHMIIITSIMCGGILADWNEDCLDY